MTESDITIVVEEKEKLADDNDEKTKDLVELSQTSSESKTPEEIEVNNLETEENNDDNDNTVYPLACSSDYFLSSSDITNMQISEEEYPIKLKNKIYPCLSDKFHLRVGPNYSSKKMKAPSPIALMDLVGCDMFNTPLRIDNIGSQIRIPPEWTNVDTHGSGVPPLFIVNCQLPSDCSVATVLANVFTDISNGPGYSCVLYFKLSESTLEALKDESTATPAVRLFANYCREAPELDSDPKSKYKGRFKVICNCENLDDFGLPALIKSYNSKPVLIRNSGKLFRGPNYIEMDANLHSFGSLFRKGLGEVLPMYERMILGMGFCIESRDDEEMPETLFGAATFNCPKLSTLPKWPREPLTSPTKHDR